MIDNIEVNKNTCHLSVKGSDISNHIFEVSKKVNQRKNCIYLYLHKNTYRDELLGRNISNIENISKLSKYLKLLNLELDERKDNVHRSCSKKLDKNIYQTTFLILDDFDLIYNELIKSQYVYSEIMKDLNRLLNFGKDFDIFVHIASSKSLEDLLKDDGALLNMFQQVIVIDDKEFSKDYVYTINNGKVLSLNKMKE